MTWRVEVTTSTPGLDRIRRGVDKTTWALIGEAAVRYIVRDTQAGRDENGKRFRKYSKTYRALRDKAGYPTRPDLTVTGQMLNSVSVVAVTADSVSIGLIHSQRASGSALTTMARSGGPSPGNPFAGFSDTDASVETKARATHAARPWFGFGGPSSKRRARITDEAVELYREALFFGLLSRRRG